MATYVKKRRLARGGKPSKPKKAKRVVKKLKKAAPRKVAAKKKKVSVVRKPAPKRGAKKTAPKKRVPVRKAVKKTARKVAKKTVRKPVRKPSRPSRLELQRREAEERAERAEARLADALERLVKLEEEAERRREEERKREESRAMSAAEEARLLRERQSVFRDRFNTILEQARRLGQIPDPFEGYGRSTVSTPSRQGETMAIQIDRKLKPETLSQILETIVSATKWMENLVFPVWLGEISLVGLGEKLVGYKATTLQVDDPIAKWFQVLGIESTGVQDSYKETIDSLSSILERLANDDSTIVYVTHVIVTGFLRPRGK